MNKPYFTYNITVNQKSAGKRIDHFLTYCAEQGEINYDDLGMVLSRTRIQKFIHDGNILVNDITVKQSYMTRDGDRISLKIPVMVSQKLKAHPERIYFEIVYNDKDIAVINKPAGLVVHPAYGHKDHTLLNGLLYTFPELKKNTNLSRTGMVHRLDRNTSGLLIITKNEPAQYNIIMQFKTRTIQKEYAAIVMGKIMKEEGEIHTRIGRNPMNRKRMTVLITGGKESYTKYKVIEYLNGGTFVKLVPHTGRTHQLRVHMSYIHHPVIGDHIYARKRSKYHYLGLILHSKKIQFIHPRTNKPMEFDSDLPERFQIILQKGEV